MGDKQKKLRSFKINLNDDNIYDDYCVDEAREVILQDSLFSRLKNLAELTPVNQNICFNLVKEYKQVDINQKEFEEAYTNTIKTKKIINKHEVNRCLLSGLSFLFVALILIFFDVYVASYQGKIIAYLVEVAAWVFAWVAVEVLGIHLLQLLIERNKLKRMLKAKIKMEN